LSEFKKWKDLSDKEKEAVFDFVERIKPRGNYGKPSWVEVMLEVREKFGVQIGVSSLTARVTEYRHKQETEIPDLPDQIIQQSVLPFEPIASRGYNPITGDINPFRLLKRDFVWLHTNRCFEHGRTYAEHPNCLKKDLESGKLVDSPVKEKIAFLDIEAASLKANYGYTISYGIGDLDSDDIKMRVITPYDIREGDFDKNICIQLCKDLREYDRIVVFYGKDRRFDIPFLRSRVLYWYQHCKPEEKKKLLFPRYMELIVEDLYDTVKSKFCLSNNRMITISQFLGIPAKTHPINQDIWLKAMAGRQDAIDYIVEHNIEDVITTKELWKSVHEFMRRCKTSI
jgi:uncharacterized protein YprB with RNaseH-like and TPR domain